MTAEFWDVFGNWCSITMHCILRAVPYSRLNGYISVYWFNLKHMS